MEYRTLKNSEDKPSLLGLGFMRLPCIDGVDEKIDYEKAQEIVDYCYDNGVNYYDTAYFYHGGMSEEFVGTALSKYPRESFFLASKMPVYSLKEEADIPTIFETQLKRLKTEYLDFYLYHAINGESFAKAESLGLYEFMQEQKKNGKIRHIGFSFHGTPEELEAICAAHPWEFAQLQLNYLDWELYRSREQYEILEKYGIPCIVMEPVRGGRLADLGPTANELLKSKAPEASIASWAFRYVAGLPNVMTILSGMSTLEQVKDNIKTFSSIQPLSQQEKEALDKATAIHKAMGSIGCTACNYCMPCPAGVNIPGIFALYNQSTLQSGPQRYKEAFEKSYAELPEGEKATHCIDCGSCESVCPQHLTIPSLLHKLEEGTPPVSFE